MCCRVIIKLPNRSLLLGDSTIRVRHNTTTQVATGRVHIRSHPPSALPPGVSTSEAIHRARSHLEYIRSHPPSAEKGRQPLPTNKLEQNKNISMICDNQTKLMLRRTALERRGRTAWDGATAYLDRNLHLQEEKRGEKRACVYEE